MNVHAIDLRAVLSGPAESAETASRTQNGKLGCVTPPLDKRPLLPHGGLICQELAHICKVQVHHGNLQPPCLPVCLTDP